MNSCDSLNDHLLLLPLSIISGQELNPDLVITSLRPALLSPALAMSSAHPQPGSNQEDAVRVRIVVHMPKKFYTYAPIPWNIVAEVLNIPQTGSKDDYTLVIQQKSKEGRFFGFSEERLDHSSSYPYYVVFEKFTTSRTPGSHSLILDLFRNNRKIDTYVENFELVKDKGVHIRGCPGKVHLHFRETKTSAHCECRDRRRDGHPRKV